MVFFTSISQAWFGPDWNRISLPFEPTDSKFKNARIFFAQGCCVMKPWAACNGVSSAPLKRNNTLCRKRVSSFDRTRKISNITQQLAASSLAPGLIYWNGHNRNWILIHRYQFSRHIKYALTFRPPNQNGNSTLMCDCDRTDFHLYQPAGQQHSEHFDRHLSCHAVWIRPNMRQSSSEPQRRFSDSCERLVEWMKFHVWKSQRRVFRWRSCLSAAVQNCSIYSNHAKHVRQWTNQNASAGHSRLSRLADWIAGIWNTNPRRRPCQPILRPTKTIDCGHFVCDTPNRIYACFRCSIDLKILIKID